MRVISHASRSIAHAIHVPALIIMALCLFASPRAGAQVLVSNNSTLTVNPFAQAALNSWTVDGVEELNELSNWYRIGPAGPERSCHTLAFVSAVPTGPDGITVTYSHPQFNISFDFGVLGGAPGSGYSRMGETVHITNITGQPLEFHFFEYVDLDLSNTPGDDIGIPLTPTSLEQYDGQTIVTTGTLRYDHHEFANFPNTLNHLLNAGPSLLNDQPPFGVPFGPNDITWALEWDFGGPGAIMPPILPFQTVTIEKFLECNHIPEPCSAMLGGILFFGTIRSRRKQ